METTCLFKRGGITVKVKKVLNNSVILATDENGKECMILAKGIGFRGKVNQMIEMSDSDQVFYAKDQRFKEDLQSLAKETNPVYFEITQRIVKIMQGSMNTSANDYIYITLTDHIRFAISRYKDNLTIRNWAITDIKRFYPKEYKIGLMALDIIKDELSIQLPEDEAGNIAFHLVNAQINKSNSNTASEITNIVKISVNAVRYFYKFDLDEQSMNYSRFITHLQFFAQRVLDKALLESEDDTLYDQINIKYPEEFKCAGIIGDYVEKNYSIQMTSEEQMYLALHIKRIISRN